MKQNKAMDKLFYENFSELHRNEFGNLKDELGYLYGSIGEAIKSVSIEEYGVHWLEYKSYVYRLTPLQKIEIREYKNRIKIYSKFVKDRPLMNSDYRSIIFNKLHESTDGFIAEIEQQNLKEDEKIYYGRNEVRWERVQRSIQISMNSEFRNEKNERFKPFMVKKRKDKYTVFLDKGPEFRAKELYVDGKKVDFEISEIGYEFKRLWAYSPKNEREKFHIDFQRLSTRKVETREKIRHRFVMDEEGNIYRFSLITDMNKKREKGIWVMLEDVNEKETTEGRTRKDIFFELLRGAMDFEVWEKPRIDYRKKENRIRVLQINMEEGLLHLERKPTTEIIYPPENTYQLRMQRNAVGTLLHRPSPEHIPLLKIFMDRNKISFDGVKKPQYNIKWQFLRDTSREGTEEQRDFVKRSLGTPDFTLLEGPPGSGKTTAISELIYHLLVQGNRVLMVASTHVAVDNVLEKLHKHFDGKPMEKGIVPLRIGREEVISEVIKDYQIENRVKKAENLFNNEDWFLSVDEKKKREYVEELIVHSSNLVCGTTIGILQYPPFKKLRNRKYFSPEFDYLIIDEASKTTLQEFLVPAVNAKKWIIVGDVKQLSPYTDTLQIRLLIDNAESDKNMKMALTAIFNIIFNRGGAKVNGNSYSPPFFIYVAPSNIIKKIAEIIKEKINEIHRGRSRNRINRIENEYAIVVSEKIYNSIKRLFSPEELDSKILSEMDIANGNYALPHLLSKEIIFAEESMFIKYHSNFPWTHILLYHNEKFKNHPHNYRHLYWYRKYTDNCGIFPYALRSRRAKFGAILEYDEIQEEIKEAFQKDWANELAWRLKRIQELEYEKSDEGSKGYYRRSVFALMPPRPKSKNHRNPYRAVKKSARLWMPSILKSLQEGINPEWQDKDVKTSFSHGLPEEVKRERFSTLIYQHRMHPHISSIPRELFYDNKALKDDEFVKTGGRDWGYKQYRKRIAWINVSHKLKEAKVYKNVNKAEGKAILKELEKFIEWDTTQENKHTAILLSFYEGQRKHIRDLLREKYPDNSKKQTRFRIKGVDVRVYTVDRVQGKEGDIVFLSMVRNKGSVGFMDSPNRLNVAITRAKYQIVFVGDIEFFRKQNASPSLKGLAERIKKDFEVIEYGK